MKNTLNFSVSKALRNKCYFICSIDEGWNKIVLNPLDSKLYHVSEGLQEHEGHVYMNELEQEDIDKYSKEIRKGMAKFFSVPKNEK